MRWWQDRLALCPFCPIALCPFFFPAVRRVELEILFDWDSIFKHKFSIWPCGDKHKLLLMGNAIGVGVEHCSYRVAFIDSISPHPQPPLPALSTSPCPLLQGEGSRMKFILEREADRVYSGEGAKATTIFERNLV